MEWELKNNINLKIFNLRQFRAFSDGHTFIWGLWKIKVLFMFIFEMSNFPPENYPAEKVEQVFFVFAGFWFDEKLQESFEKKKRSSGKYRTSKEKTPNTNFSIL